MKTSFTHFPFKVFRLINERLTYYNNIGKHSGKTWRKLSEDELLDKILRHLTAYIEHKEYEDDKFEFDTVEGEQIQSWQHHLVAVACNVIFLIAKKFES